MDLRITYHVHGADERAAVARAREIALEQTVELAADALSADVVARIVGRIAAVEPLGEGRWSSVIAYDPAVVSGEMPQLLNLLFGNISLQAGVVVASVEWPLQLLASLGGPRQGIAGVRANRETGGNTLYLPNVTSGVTAMLERAAFARRAGCRGCVVNALPAGLDAVRAVAATGLAVMSHPSLAGAFFHADHGIAPP